MKPSDCDASPQELTAAEIRKLRAILVRHISPWIARSLCRLALKGLKK